MAAVARGEAHGPPGADAPLAGVLVVDLGRIIAGPLCAWLLASLGATVVRVDTPGGDVSWQAPPHVGPAGRVSGGTRLPDEIAIGHLKRGRGKRSVVLDYRQPPGRSVLLRLVDLADVVVENFSPGALEPLGLDYATLSARNPRLVYCAISGYGLSGPRHEWPAMDLAVQAASGFMARTGFPDGPPLKTGPTIGDQVPAVFGALGVLAALRRRERTGEGALVDVAMQDVMTALIWDEPLEWYEQRRLGDRWGNSDPRGGPLNVYGTSDGWLALTVSSDEHWARLCRLMGREDLLDEVRTLGDRARELGRLDAEVAARCASGSAGDLAERLRAQGIPSAEVASPTVARDDPDLAARGVLRPLVHPRTPDVASGFLGATLPVRIGSYEPQEPPAETLGESTREVLTEVLGIEPDEVASLAEAGVIP